MDNNNQPINSSPVTPTPTAPPAQAQPPAPKTTGSNKMIFILVGILVIIILGLGGFIFLNNRSGTKDAQISPAPTSANSIETSPSPVVSLVESDLLIYSSTDKKWQVAYPKDATAEKREATQIGPAGVGEVAVIYKLGPTQTSGTEFHDGYSVSVGAMKKPATTTLEKFATDQINPNPEAPVTMTPFQKVTINGLSGITTIGTGMATFKFVYLQAPNNPELVYYMAILAEGAQKTTYQAETNKILESFKLL